MKKILCVILAVITVVLYGACTPKGIDVSTPPSGMTVRFINVEQGDCTLIESGGKYMLVDSGESTYSATVKDIMRMSGVDKLTYVLVTHPHSDHFGGMRSIIKAYDTENFIAAKTECDDVEWTKLLKFVHDKDINYIDAAAGETYELGDAAFTILAPLGSGYKDDNNFSIAIMVKCGDAKFLLTGDAKRESEYEMLSAYENLDADVYKCGHHGASHSSTAAFLREVNPVYAVVSCAKHNSYGHPSQETLDRLSLLGTKVYRTDILGSIIAVTDGKTITISGEAKADSSTYTVGEKNTVPSALDLVGNVKSKRFHDPICSSAKEINEKNRISFTSRQEALDQGYTPCSQCQP